MSATLSHVRPAAHAWPHPPQFASSLAMSTQLPLQQRSAAFGPHDAPFGRIAVTHALSTQSTVRHGLVFSQSVATMQNPGGGASIAASTGGEDVVSTTASTLVRAPPQKPAIHGCPDGQPESSLHGAPGRGSGE